MSDAPDDQRVIAGRYRLLSALGQGGMGVVWRAVDEVLQREVAVKEVRAPAGLGSADIRRLYERLEREAWAAARISHRNVVTVYDVANDEGDDNGDDGRPWIVMELIRGLSLSDTLDAEGPLPPRRAARIGAEILAALRGAHAAGVLHRDVKPGNVLLANDGRVVLTDFGIATMEGTSSLTMTGELIGSPEFLAPERALGRTPGPESDLWSLGVLLYAAVEGNSPFRQNTPLSTLRAVVEDELPPARRAGPLAPVIEGLLRKDPAERLSAEETEARLREVASGDTTPRTMTTAATPVTPAPGTPPLGAFGPHPPTVAGPGVAAGSSPGPPALPLVASTAAPAPSRQGRTRRTGAALAAGVAVALLAAGGISWALLKHADPAGKADGGTSQGATGGADAGAAVSGGVTDPTDGPTDGPDDGPVDRPDDGKDNDTGDGGTGSDGGASGRPSGGTTSETPHQSVTVKVEVSTAAYHGSCPPPDSAAPRLRATFTVGRVPVSVRYRWVPAGHEGPATQWRTLHFAADDQPYREVRYTPAVSDEDGTRQYRIGVEVSSPVQVRSDVAQFTVTCRRESPTDRPTTQPPYPSGSPAGGTGAGPQTSAGTVLTQPR